MKSIFGKLFNTLSYRVNKEIKESLYQNEVFLKSQWSFLEHSIVLWSTHYKKYIFLENLLFLLIITNLFLWQPWAKPYVTECLPNWKSLLKWQEIFLAGQLTIVGVVYPLVIGLMSVLFQNKSAKKSIFITYQKYSGFMFAGLSGLALSAFIILTFFLRAHFTDSDYIAFCIVSGFWLIANILLTAWFFVQTFQMLDETARDRLIIRYAIHESCEFDIRRRIQQLLLENSIVQKLLHNPNEQVLKVLNYKYSNDNYNEITRTVPNNSSIKNISFGLINIAINFQIVILKFRKNNSCTIVIQQPLRNSHNTNTIVIARYHGFKINLIVKLLIKCAFSFKCNEPQTGLGLTAILNGFVGSASDALRDGNVKDFSDAINNIASWHTEIALALAFNNDEGNEDNWLLLPASSFFGRSFLDELLREYYQLARESVEKIADNSSFYSEMLYLHQKIFNGRNNLIKHEIKSLIRGNYYLWYLLMQSTKLKPYSFEKQPTS